MTAKYNLLLQKKSSFVDVENKRSFCPPGEQPRAHSCCARTYELFKTVQSVSLKSLISLRNLVT